MSEEQIIALLTEIRDLQKQSLESRSRILEKQDEEIALQKRNAAEFQKKYLARQKMVIFTVIAITLVAFVIVALSSVVIKGVNH